MLSPSVLWPKGSLAPRPAAAGIDGVIDDQRLVVTQVAVGQAVHQPVADAVHPLSGALLRDAVTRGRTQLREPGDRQAGVLDEGRVGRRGPVNMELEQG